MAKKPVQEERLVTPANSEREAIQGEGTLDNNADLGFDPSTDQTPMEDFDVDSEYKPTPLIPKGQFVGNISSVKYNPDDQTIDWVVTFEGNGEDFLMLDQETPIDGATMGYRNFLPKPGDENERTKTGRQTKRQAKINMMKDFADNMKIQMKSPTQILESISNAEWIGLRVKANVGFRMYEGRTFNNLEKLFATE